MTINYNKNELFSFKKCIPLTKNFILTVHAVILKLYNSHCCSFYGSSIWYLSSRCVSKLYTAWNTAIRILYNVPRDTHRYLIKSILLALIADELYLDWYGSGSSFTSTAFTTWHRINWPYENENFWLKIWESFLDSNLNQ